MGAQLVKEVATKTNDIAGDGTTTATVLAQALVREGLRNVAAGANPMSLKKGIEKAVAAGRREPRPVRSSRSTTPRTRSPRSRPSRLPIPRVGEVIADAIDKVGKDGVVTVEESNTFGMDLDFVEGMQFDKGFLSPYFVTDAERQEAVLDEPYILFNQGKIGSNVQDHPAGAREGHAVGQAAADHRRGHRGRGPRHSRREQDPRHLQLGRGQGAGLR